MIDIEKRDFGTLCLCAVRYSMGRRTYMPSLIQSIVIAHLDDLEEADIRLLLRERAQQERMGIYGDNVDKRDWLKFWKKLEEYLEANYKAEEN